MAIGFAIIASILSFYFYDRVLILATSFGGSYMLLRGISLYAGGFPNEFTLVEKYEKDVPDAFSAWYYLYLVFIVALSLAGAFVQLKYTNVKEKEPTPTYQQLEKK